jgi:hypothetical protein
LSEDGSVTSSFAIALTEEPLSLVILKFSSRNGTIALTPSELAFDFTNFTRDQTILVVAVNDNVDEGTSYSDVIETLVWSEDSFTECDMEERTTCGQAAKYSNFSVASQRVLVQDDDEAGVMIGPSLQLTATYDNYGNSLVAAMYALNLTSMPKKTVIISLSGSSPYSIVTPATIKIVPTDWATTVSIEVRAGVSVEPYNGFALDTSFEFSALNWIDDDLPLTYVFGTAAVERDGTNGTLDTSFLSPFGDAQSDASYSGITLSQGFNHSYNTVGAYVRAIDSYGATGIATTKVHVQPKVMSMGELFNLSVALATDALESGNADTAKQVLSATVNSMAYTNTDV